MVLSRANIVRRLSIARCGAAASLMTMLWSLSVAAQPGTVAVTGDGTATVLRPSVTDGEKTKSKAAKKPSAPAPTEEDTETASREPPPPASGGGHSIVALVNDEPITAYEIDQRAMMLSGSTVADKAKANFQAIVRKSANVGSPEGHSQRDGQGQRREVARRDHRDL